MKSVNHCLIEYAFGYLMVAEAENGGPLGLDPDNEIVMKRAFQDFVEPEVTRWSEVGRNTLKLSFAYFMKKPQVLEDDVLANISDLTMPEPGDVSQLFRWLYEVLFPTELIEQVDVSNVEENNDPMAANAEPPRVS